MSERWEFMDRLRAAWRILCGKATMYRVEARGPVELAAEQDLHMIECRMKVSRVVIEDGS